MCLGHICSPSSGGILYIYNWYVLCFLVDCLSAGFSFTLATYSNTLHYAGTRVAHLKKIHTDNRSFKHSHCLLGGSGRLSLFAVQVPGGIVTMKVDESRFNSLFSRYCLFSEMKSCFVLVTLNWSSLKGVFQHWPWTWGKSVELALGLSSLRQRISPDIRNVCGGSHVFQGVV
jgi:hypothetical protein